MDFLFEIYYKNSSKLAFFSSININWSPYVAMSESGKKSLGIDSWNINLYFKLFFRIVASRKVRKPTGMVRVEN
jgi:hypothetical protein